jgi:hypothetical protein
LFSAPQPERRIRMQIQQHTPESNQAALSNLRLFVFLFHLAAFTFCEGDANEAVAQEQHQVVLGSETERKKDAG